MFPKYIYGLPEDGTIKIKMGQESMGLTIGVLIIDMFVTIRQSQ